MQKHEINLDEPNNHQCELESHFLIKDGLDRHEKLTIILFCLFNHGKKILSKLSEMQHTQYP